MSGRKTPIPAPIEKPNRVYELVNLNPVKDYIDFGINKNIVDLKIRKMVDVEVREERMKKGETRDMMKIFSMIAIALVVGLIGFTLITQFMNYIDVSQSLSACIVDQATVKSQLLQCQAQLTTATPPPPPPLQG